MKNRIISFGVLFVVWILLSSSFEVEQLVAGALASAVIALLICPRCGVFKEVKLTPKSIAYFFAYWVVFVIDLVKSNFDVTRRILNPKLPINPGIVEVKTKLKSPLGKMLLANSITLTPGTLTVEVNEDSFFIHWIDTQEVEIDKASEEIVSKFEKYLEVIYG